MKNKHFIFMVLIIIMSSFLFVGCGKNKACNFKVEDINQIYYSYSENNLTGTFNASEYPKTVEALYSYFEQIEFDKKNPTYDYWQRKEVINYQPSRGMSVSVILNDGNSWDLFATAGKLYKYGDWDNYCSNFGLEIINQILRPID